MSRRTGSQWSLAGTLFFATLLSSAASNTVGAQCRDSYRDLEIPPALHREIHSFIDAYGQRLLRWPNERSALGLWVQGGALLSAREGSDGHRSPITEHEWRSAIFDAAEAWRLEDIGLSVRPEMDSAKAQIRVFLAPIGLVHGQRTGKVADTTGQILEAWISLGSTDAKGRRYSLRDARAAAAHELGHTLGLSHRTHPTSVMTASVSGDVPDETDRALLQAWYHHSDVRLCRLRQ